MHPTLGAICLVLLMLPILIYVTVVPILQEMFARVFIPEVSNHTEFDFIVVRILMCPDIPQLWNF